MSDPRGAIEIDFTIGEYLDLCKWFEALPLKTQKLLVSFPPGSKWRLRSESCWSARTARIHAFPDADWLSPLGILSDGRLNMVHVDGATNLPLLGDYKIRPQDLVPAGS